MLVTGFTLSGLAIDWHSVCDIFWSIQPVGTDPHRMPHSTDIDNIHSYVLLTNVEAPNSLSLFVSLLTEVAAAWEALFLYDSMLFLMTLHKAYKTRHELRQERLRIPLVVIILRDGSIYFGVMALANLVNISTFYYPDPFLRGALCTFASSMSVTMMSRLMINLHKIAETGLYTSHITTCQLGTYSVFVASPQDAEDQNIFNEYG
ncbi:hypothetical protein DFH05DRAFT_1523972 [Lentinula detonsa]|uniref:Uncharacterized protein n=1 Tax=Lentinula detonsa TaxID=2804962 RepID=A0A9W8P332_9AGAR|nr:hypothetical protein DFH05DRAFT_1523972 [Lentinula detonsa]